MNQLSQKQRSLIMQSVKSQNTKIERTLRLALWEKGIRYRKNYAKLLGKPDIVITKYHIAIFCDGEFWHGKTHCEESILSNKKYWLEKIKRNRDRDLDVTIRLRDNGWTVFRFWEKDIEKEPSKCIEEILTAINKIKAKAGAHMSTWKDFENECFSYLKQTYENKNTTFKQYGSSDPTQSDICVSLKSGNIFFIETKEKQAQCGQFVVLPNEKTKTFYFSLRNKSTETMAVNKIISYMNSNYQLFSQAGTKGEILNMPKTFFYDWINEYYTSKNVKFFITKNNDFIIIPIEKFSDYFDVTAKYRIKKSGSRPPSASKHAEIKALLTAILGQCYLSKKDNKLHLRSKKDAHGLIIHGKNCDFLIKENSKQDYIVRQLSNTLNANVIFSIRLKQEQQPTDLLAFESFIKS